MDESPYVANDRDMHEGERDSVLELGVIGHDDVDAAYDVGTNGGPILALVQLYSGRDYTQPKKDARTQGSRIVARIPSNLSSLPPKGTEVLVAMPNNMATKPGAAVIIAILGRVDSKAAYGNMKEGEMCIHPGDADNASRVMFKADKSIILYTTDNALPTGKGVYLRVAPTALEFYAPWGRLVFDATGFHAVTASGARLDMGGIGGLPSPLDTLASYATLSAATVKCEGSVVFLGPADPPVGPPTVYGPALQGITGLAGLPSTGVYITV